MSHYMQQLAALPAAKRAISHKRYDSLSEITCLHNLHFTDCQFTAFTVPGAQWSGLTFERCEFSHLVFENARLADCRFIDCRLIHCRFEESECSEWISHKTLWQDCEWRRASSRKLTFQDGLWQDIRILDSISEHWNTVNVGISELHIQGGQACDWNLCRSTLEHCHWLDVMLARLVAGECKLYGIRLQRIYGLAPVWFACHWQASDLSRLQLTGGSFHRNHFTHCDLSAGHLQGTVMCEVTLDTCVLDATRFEGIQGQHMRLNSCSLTNCGWAQAHLQHAGFYLCKGENCDLTGADLRGSLLTGLPDTANLSQARLHSAQGVSERTASPPEPQLDAIASWYASVQPGPERLRSTLISTGASRYV